MKPYLALLVAAGLFTAAVVACSSDDDTQPSATDGGADGSPTGTGDDDDILADGGVCEPTIGSSLTQCDCNPVGSVNADKPICGCPGVTGQIGSGVQVGAVGGKYVCGAVDGANSRLVMGVQSTSGGSIWTVDLKTGNRVVVSGSVTDPATSQAQTTGTGDPMATPAAIRIGTDGWYAFEGTSSTKQIQRVDPASGARTTLLTTDQMTKSISGGHPIACTGAPSLDTSFARPEAGMGIGANNELYVGMGTSPGYVAVAKLTFGGSPTCTIVSGDNFDSPNSNPVGSGPNLDGLNAVDFANGVIYALDAVKANVYTIDPSTGTRTLVSTPALIDAGTPIKDAGADAADAGYDAAGGNGTGQVTETHCFTDAVSGSNVFAFTSATTAWSGAAQDVAADLFTNINLTTGDRTCFATTVPCHPDQQNGQAIDRSGGIFASPTPNMLLTAGATTIWTVDTLGHVANVISE